MADRDVCPYCGSKMLHLPQPDAMETPSVRCSNCRARGPESSTNMEAIRLFRRRVGMSREFCEAMQEVILLDVKSFEDLIQLGSPCDETILKDKWAQVMTTDGKEYVLRLLGFVNGVLGRITGGLGVAVYKDEVKGLGVRIVDLEALHTREVCGIS